MTGPFVTTFLVLGAGGITNAAYLLYKRRQQQPLTCPLNHDCSVVTESRWSRFLGVRNEVWGMLFFPLTLALFLAGFSFYAFLLAAIGFLYSLFLIAVQAWIIKDYCFYCLVSAIITLLLFFNAWYLWMHP